MEFDNASIKLGIIDRRNDKKRMYEGAWAQITLDYVEGHICLDSFHSMLLPKVSSDAHLSQAIE
jgi:hypothetical protein